MLSVDSLVTDLMFLGNSEIKLPALLAALGGEEEVKTRKVLDPDMQDPRLEMELSPSMPFRRRGERRLMFINDSVAPMRQDPAQDPIIPLDLRVEKERLIAACESNPVRLGRIFALGSWGDAILVARSAADLRGIALISWVLDPQTDVSGKTRATRLSQKEFEEKIMSYEKRLEELDEATILANLGAVNFERRGDLLVVDVLEADGTWDQRKSIALEMRLAALDSFSILPGAPSTVRPSSTDGVNKAATNGASGSATTQPIPKMDAGSNGRSDGKSAAPVVKPEPPAEPAKPVSPLKVKEHGSRVVLMFPQDRFDLDVAAAMGKKDWNHVLSNADPLSGKQRETIHKDGADFVAPLEFLSEVFYEGRPASKKDLATHGVAVGAAQSLEVHCPRFGSVCLVDVPQKGRFISNVLSASTLLELLEP